MEYIGVDIGGTKCAVVRADENGKILEKVKFDTTGRDETLSAIYNAVNALCLAVSGQKDMVPVGVEPILFGLFTTVWDLVFLRIKRVMKRIVSDAGKQVKNGNA